MIEENGKYNGVFKTINNKNTAYWLGFLAADGSIHKTKNKLSIGLAQKDKGHIEKFKNFIESDAVIYDRDMLCTTNGKSYPSSFIQILDKQIVNDLQQYRIVPNKSAQDINFLQYIPEEYKIYFILGYFDGDGYYICTNKSCGFGWCGCKDNINAITDYTKQYFNLATTAKCHPYSKSPTTYEFTDTKFNDIKVFCEFYLSQVGKIDLLERKVKKAQELLDLITNRIKSADRTQSQSITNKKIKTSVCPICNREFVILRNDIGKYCSQECVHVAQRKSERPARNVLKQLIRTTSFLQIGKIFNVSDNAIRKWCKSLNLPHKSKDIKSISDEEWALI